MNESEITLRHFNIGPSVELSEFNWIKTSVGIEVTGGDSKTARKKAELEYWKAVELDLKLAKEVKEAFDSEEDPIKGRKAIMKLASKRIEILSNTINKD